MSPQYIKMEKKTKKQTHTNLLKVEAYTVRLFTVAVFPKFISYQLHTCTYLARDGSSHIKEKKESVTLDTRYKDNQYIDNLISDIYLKKIISMLCEEGWERGTGVHKNRTTQYRQYTKDRPHTHTHTQYIQQWHEKIHLTA